MRAIDIHTHVFPDEVAGKVMPMLAQKAGVESHNDGTLRGLKASMAAAGIERSVLQPVSTEPEQVKGINNWIISIEDRAFVPFGTIHPAHSGWEDELRRLHEHGIKGIKLHPEYQSFELDQPKLYRIYERLGEYGMVLMLHMGCDIAMPPPYKGLPETLAKVVSDLPGLIVIAAHMGGYLQWEAVERHLAGKKLYLETSFGVGFMPDEQFLRLVHRHGAERVLFGSDSPWRSQDQDLTKLRQTGLTEAELERICCSNALRLLGECGGGQMTED